MIRERRASSGGKGLFRASVNFPRKTSLSTSVGRKKPADLGLIQRVSSGDAAQRAALTNKLEQLEYEAKRAFEQV